MCVSEGCHVTKWRRPELLKHCIALFQGPTLHPRIRNQMLGFLSFFSTTMSHTLQPKRNALTNWAEFGYNQLHAMLSLWANWLQLNSQLNSPGVSFWLYRTSDFWLDYRGRLRCTYQTSAESVKIASKTDELWGARHAATIALARYYFQVNGAAELVAHARRTLVLNRLFNGRTKCSPRRQKLQISPNCC